MRKVILASFLAVFFVVFYSLCFVNQAQAATAFDKKLQFQAYTEYIHFTSSEFERGSWGGGLLGRLLFNDWLGIQTNMAFYGDAKTKNLPENLSFSNWRLTLLLHSYLPNTYEKWHGHIGAGIGVQFNEDMSPIRIKDPVLGHVLAGLGYAINETFSLEAEIGYQFGTADTVNYSKDVDMDAVFIRAGANLKF